MPGKTRLLLLLSALLLTMCKNYANEPINYRNGLSCRNYVDYRFFEWSGSEYSFYVTEEGADCTYMCPNGVTRPVAISGSISSFYAASSDELDGQFCGVAAAPTPTPTPADSPTPASEPSGTPTSSPTPAASLTAVVTADPLLAETVSMCDLGGKLINFRLLAPASDLTMEGLEVEIAEQESTCYVNPTNPSLLTCVIPNDISFPAHVVVRQDGAVVNDFTYTGVGCSILTTPTSRPRSYP
ncbi:MAG TPA: hypothetical protein VJ821_16855 [Anaerolineales bacterium]|nr:hypothetical protein [Anaerolineales bacterium]